MRKKQSQETRKARLRRIGVRTQPFATFPEHALFGQLYISWGVGRKTRLKLVNLIEGKIRKRRRQYYLQTRFDKH